MATFTPLCWCTHHYRSYWDADGTLSLFVLLLSCSGCLSIRLTSLCTQNAAALLSFLSGYSWYVQMLSLKFLISLTLYLSQISSFMGPLAGVMCSDYYLVRKGKLNVKELYNPNGLYRYDGGWNWRAYTAFLYVVS